MSKPQRIVVFDGKSETTGKGIRTDFRKAKPQNVGKVGCWRVLARGASFMKVAEEAYNGHVAITSDT